MHSAWRSVLCVTAAVIVVSADAQTNPAQRPSITTPRFATQNRAPLQVIETAVSGASPFGDTCGDTNGVLYIGAEVEPHIAVNPLNPNNLVGVWQQDRYSNGSSRGVLSGASMDGGATWTQRALPVTPCSGGAYSRASDPWVTFSPDGTAHQLVLATIGAQSVSAMLASRSTDGGLTWSTPATLIRDGSGFFNDKNTITADPLDSRFVYAVWDRLHSSGGGPTVFARTSDGGATWEAAAEIYAPPNSGQTIGNLVRVLPSGTLVDVFVQLTGGAVSTATINVMRSTDRGLTWSAPIPVSPLMAFGAIDPTTGAAIRDGAIIPQMAVAPDGTLYVVWQDARFTQLRDAVALSKSTDGGLTWSTPVRVSFDPDVAAFTPQVHVRADGMIAVSYYDFRSTMNGAIPLTDAWLARSADGVSWTETRLAQPFNLSLAPNAGGLFLGDYTGLTSSGSTFIAFFGKTNATTANRTDIFAVRTAPPAAGRQAKRVPQDGAQAPYRAERLPDVELDARFVRRMSDKVAKIMEKRASKARPPLPAHEPAVR